MIENEGINERKEIYNFHGVEETILLNCAFSKY
jgi:hypothetical protein